MERPCDSDKLLMEKERPLPPRQPAETRIQPPMVPERSRVLDRAIELELMNGRHLDPSLDGKAIRRTISNRLSAQRSRMKKTHYLADMERKAQELEKLISSLTPKLQLYQDKKRMLQLENDSLRAQLQISQAQSKISQDGLEQRRREIMELKQMLRQKGVEMQPPAAGEVQIKPVSGPDDEIMLQASGSGLDEEIMRGQEQEVVVEEEMGPKPYSIEFYEQRLMQMEMKQFIEQEMKEPQLMIEMSLDEEEEKEEEEVEVEVEVDQYLNLDADLN